jgi:iron-sulfur cluster repair protein YtfE (RIC family)
MPAAPSLLDESGNASMATAFMMSHHAFRRDLARFAAALPAVTDRNPDKLDALREEWTKFAGALHGHHHSEDTGIFPMLAKDHESLRATIEALTADHHQIDPILERGNRAFGSLPAAAQDASAVIGELSSLLDPHLAKEEAEIVPHMRSMKGFPPPANAEEEAMYADGFAWSSRGIAPEVLTKVDEMLPEGLRARLPAARAAFEERWKRVWGSVPAGSATTPIPTR